MVAMFLVASAALAHSSAPPITVDAGADRIDVAYEELMRGQPEAAILKIRSNTKLDADEPAALINLGSAYARIGRADEAQACYRSAIASNNRYDLELADGRWMDSRRAARLAVEMLAKGVVLTLR
jgi:Tfp pilus assembly protein PilF